MIVKRHTCFAGIFFADVLKYQDNILTCSYKLFPDISWERNLRGRGKHSHYQKHLFPPRFYTSACNGTLCIMHHEKMTASKRRATSRSSPCTVFDRLRAVFLTPPPSPKQIRACIEKEPFKAGISRSRFDEKETFCGQLRCAKTASRKHRPMHARDLKPRQAVVP